MPRKKSLAMVQQRLYLSKTVIHKAPLLRIWKQFTTFCWGIKSFILDCFVTRNGDSLTNNCLFNLFSKTQKPILKVPIK